MKVSVIMGIYNCESTLNDAITSIVNQTYQNWELIMCDDASTDLTYDIAKKFAEEYKGKIILIKNSINLKLAHSLNNCLAYATGDFIARMDSDDISLPDRFEKQVNFLNEHNEYDLVGCQISTFDHQGIKGTRKLKKIPDKYSMRYNVPFVHPTIMVRRKVYEILKGYRVSKETQRCEDLELWFRFFAAEFKGYNLQEPLYLYKESVSDFARRNISDGINASKVCLSGFKLLNYPKKYYIFLLKPILSSSIPAIIMKKIHESKNAKF